MVHCLDPHIHIWFIGDGRNHDMHAARFRLHDCGHSTHKCASKRLPAKVWPEACKQLPNRQMTPEHIVANHWLTSCYHHTDMSLLTSIL